jgi:hypothetical protein
MNDLDKLIDAATRGDLAEVSVMAGAHPELINQRDATGATALHYATFHGHCAVAEELVKRGAEINARDGKFGATPAGWAIEYLRERGGLLGIELQDFEHAIRQGDIHWVQRFLRRFPALRTASDPQGTRFELLAQQSGNSEIAKLFGTPVP